MRGHHRSALIGCAVLAATMMTTSAAGAGDVGPRRSSTAQIAVTEQASDQILVLESDRESWVNATIAWRWRPTAANGLGEFTDNWGLPDEAKLRHRDGRAYLLTTDSYGLAAVVPYPQGTPAYWAADAGRPNNPHSIELLPDGNVAVVASTGDYLRVYTASQGSRSTTFVEYALDGAHGVYWDADRELLWALGNHILVGLEVGGSAAAPTLTEVHRADLPTPWGHDLQPVGTDPDRLWVTTNTRVYQYSISKDAFLDDYPGAGTIDIPSVKSVGDDGSSGQVLTSSAQRGNICSWCTDTATLHVPQEAFLLHGAQIYKSRWWVDPNL